MRWADVDQQGHINNVVYVDYLQEARVDMLRTHGPQVQTADLAEGVVVVRHDVRYLAPLLFDRPSVTIESWVTEIRAATFTIAYEVFHEAPDGQRQVYLRASTVLTPFVFDEERPRRITETERERLAVHLEPPETREPKTPLPRSRPEHVRHYPVQVRFSDVDIYGHVNNVKYLEYLQESRIAGFAEVWEGLPPMAGVVAQVDVDYRSPILLRQEPYDVWWWVARVGDRSMVIESLICDGDRTLARARAAVVFFDPETQRSMVPPEVYRDRMRALLPG